MKIARGYTITKDNSGLPSITAEIARQFATTTHRADDSKIFKVLPPPPYGVLVYKFSGTTHHKSLQAIRRHGDAN